MSNTDFLFGQYSAFDIITSGQKNIGHKKRVSYFYRAAQLSTLAVFPPWGSSRGAGRKRLTPAQI